MANAARFAGRAGGARRSSAPGVNASSYNGSASGTKDERRSTNDELGDRLMTMKVRKAIFPAAGLGTRFLPATKAQPKEMLPLGDKPIIQYGVEEALSAGSDQIIIITQPGTNPLEDPL